MALLPKCIESIPLYYGKIKQDSLLTFKYGHHFLFAFTMGLVSYVYNKDPEAIKKSIQFLLDYLIGRENPKIELEVQNEKAVEEEEEGEAVQAKKKEEIESLSDGEEGCIDIETQGQAAN